MVYREDVQRVLRASMRTAVDQAGGVRGDEMRHSVDKALDLLFIFDGGGASLGVSEAARRAGLTKSTAFRLLGQLARKGFVDRDGDRYRLGRQLYELGTKVHELRPGWLHQLLVPFMIRLFEDANEAVSLAVLHDTDVFCLEQLHGHRRVDSPIRIGTRFPAYSTAIGKALLAYDPEASDRALAAELARRTPHTIVEAKQFRAELFRVRLDGIAFDNGETLCHLACVGVPILDSKGRPIAALSISGAVPRFEPRKHAQNLRQVANEASRLVQKAAANGSAVSLRYTPPVR